MGLGSTDELQRYTKSSETYISGTTGSAIVFCVRPLFEKEHLFGVIQGLKGLTSLFHVDGETLD